jgi:hypothetical protein
MAIGFKKRFKESGRSMGFTDGMARLLNHDGKTRARNYFFQCGPRDVNGGV